MGGGSNSSSSNSRPLTAGEMMERYNAGINAIGGSAPGIFDKTTTPGVGEQYIWKEGSSGSRGTAEGINWGGSGSQGGWVANPDYIPERSTYALNGPEYDSPEYASPGEAATLTGRDYEKLQNDVYRGNVVGLDYARDRSVKDVNNDAAKRGIWSSGLVMQGEKDMENAYAPAYAKAGGDATALRYQLESGENKNLNDFNLADSAQRNSMGMENAIRKYNSEWQPANFLKDIWNASGGTVSSGSGGGWQMSI